MLVVDESNLNPGLVTDTTEAPQVDSKEQTEIKRLRSKGPDYTENEGDWRFFQRSYEGGSNYVGTDTLFRHQREQTADYHDRVKRASFTNYCQPLVDFVPEYIFSKDIERAAPKQLKDEYEKFVTNCDRAGTALNAFMQQVAEDMRIFGMVFIQVDKPARDDKQEISVLEARQRGLDQPYVVIIRPLEVLDFRTDASGNLIYLKRVEYTYIPSGDNFIDIERYTEWRKEQFKISIVDVSDPKKPKLHTGDGAGIKPNPWGTIPFVQAFYKRKKSNKSVGQSFLQDIASQNRDIFNQTSLINEFLYRQCFNLLAMPAKSNVPMREQTEGNVGTSNVLEIPEDAKHVPSYVSPPVDPAKFIQAERENSVREMYRQAAQELVNEKHPSRQSGDAQRQQFSRTVPVINKTADALQYTEERMMFIWARMQGKDWDGKISYKDDYSVTNLMDLLVNLSMIFNDLRIDSPKFIKEEWKRIVREFDGKLDHVTLDEISTKIDALSDDDVMKRFATPVDRQASLGVPSTGDMIQGKRQKLLQTDTRIGAATKTRAATKEKLPDAGKRATLASAR